MSEAGYNGDDIRSVQHIIQKEQLRTDPEVQVMEDALCLVFLEFQYEDFITKHAEEKVITVLQRSWKKMSPDGRNSALNLSFSAEGKELLEKALH